MKAINKSQPKTSPNDTLINLSIVIAVLDRELMPDAPEPQEPRRGGRNSRRGARALAAAGVASRRGGGSG